MKNIYNERINQRKAGVVMLISYKVDFGAKKIIRGKEGYLIMIKKVNPSKRYTSLKCGCKTQ